MSTRLDPKTFDKLTKVAGLLESNHEGEVAAAKRAVDRLLSPFGLAFEHLDALLANNGELPRGFRDRGPEAANTQQSKAPPGQKQGFKWTTNELLLRTAVEKSCECSYSTDKYGRRLLTRLDGWDGSQLREKMSWNLFTVLERAVFLPRTIFDAVDEYKSWDQRSNEIGTLLNLGSGNHLDLPSFGRQLIIRDLIMQDIRIENFNDMILRFQFMHYTNIISRNDVIALSRDLDTLVQKGKVRGANTRRKRANVLSSTQVRRSAVAEMITEHGMELSDREIARRMGVSPSTVGNIRRRLNL